MPGRILDDWRPDSFYFARSGLPRIVTYVVAFVLARLLKVVSRHFTALGQRSAPPSAVRAQQLRTVSSVIYSVGVFVILFLPAMQILARLDIKVRPLLASAGIPGWPSVSARRRWSKISLMASSSGGERVRPGRTRSGSGESRVWWRA